MIIVLKPSVTPEQVIGFTTKLTTDYGVNVNR